MELAFKEICFICATALSIGATWTNNKRDNKLNAADIKKLSEFFKKVILDDNGEIRLVDKKACKEQKVELQASILEGKQTTADVSKKLTELNENIILIMYHLNVDPDNKKIKGLRHE